jgi:hypothetical protein
MPAVTSEACALTAASGPSTAAVPSTDSISARDGHTAWCTEPSRHHDQVSSVTKGRNGASSLTSTESAV